MANNPIMQKRNQNRKQLLTLVQFSILLALEAVVCFTPLGSLQIGSVISATLSHIPVILAAVLLGPLAGSLMGFFFGLFSFIVWTFMPPNPLFAFVFTPFYSAGDAKGSLWSLVICFLPRILLGLSASLMFRAFQKTKLRGVAGYTLSGVLSTVLHTTLVLGSIYLFFGKPYAAAMGISYSLLLGALATVLGTNGLFEAIIAGFIGYGVCQPVHKYIYKYSK